MHWRAPGADEAAFLAPSGLGDSPPVGRGRSVSGTPFTSQLLVGHASATTEPGGEFMSIEQLNLTGWRKAHPFSTAGLCCCSQS